LQTLESLAATRFSTPESWTKEPQSCVASIRLGAVTTGMPVISARRRHTSRRSRVGVDAGADGGGAEVDLADQQRGFLQALLVLAEHGGVGRELLAQGHRHRVLQLGAAHLQHVGELLGLALEGARR
jgi:hypothetical protein